MSAVSVLEIRMIQRQVSWLTRTATSVFLNHSVPSLSIFPIRTDTRTGEHLRNTHFRTVTSSSVGYKIQDNLRDCYSLLNVKDGCSQEELKEAYIRLAKLYHPDSQSETADPKKFGQVKEAYKTIKRKIRADNNNVVTDEDDVDDESILKWRAPQHRQFLSNEGVGSGTTSERQKQYEQLRVAQATNRIYQYRLKKLAPEGDNALLAKDKRAARTRKISKREWYRRGNDDENLKAQLKSNTMDRMVEDMILESMSKGSFENLPGYGKPHKFGDKDRNPYVDKVTQKLNQILIDDDLKPEWISMQKEIRSEMNQAREKLAISRYHLGDPPHSDAAQKHWKMQEEKFQSSVIDVNQRIDNFNLIVPILNKQMVHYDSEREIKNIFCDCEKYISPNCDLSQYLPHFHGQVVTAKHETIPWREVWKDIKGLFKS